MSAPTTLTTRSIASALGVKGGVQPLLASGTIWPVAIYADFSRTLSAEAIEPRAIVAASLTPALNEAAVYELHSRSPGGIVIENLVLETEHDPSTWLGSGTFWFLYRTAASYLAALGGGVPMRKTEIGGPVTGSAGSAANIAGALIDWASLPWSYHMRTDNLGLRIFVPSGWFCGLIFGRLGSDTICSMHIREVLDALGPP